MNVCRRSTLQALAAVIVSGLVMGDAKSGPKEAAVRKRALLVGNNDYRSLRHLSNAVKDARDMEVELKALGFVTTLRTNDSAAGFASSLKSFAATVERGDIAFFFYAGHGMQVDGVNYIIPVDFNMKDSPEGLRLRTEVAAVQDALQATEAGLTILTIDACRNNLDRNAPDEFRSWFVPMRSGAGGLIVLSAGPGEESDDGQPGRNGLFTSHLLKEIRRPMPVVGLFRKVRDGVYKASGERQRPYVIDDVIGDFYLAGQGSGEGVPLSVDAQSEILNGLRLLRAGDYAGAAKAFDHAAQIRPADAYAYNAAGLAYGGQRQYQIAAERFSTAIALNPAYGTAYFNRALIYLDSPSYRLAVQDLSWTIDLDPIDPVAHTKRGLAYLGMRQYEEAAGDFKRALQLYPQDFEALRGLGVVQYRLNDYRGSLSSLSRAIEYRSDYVVAYEDRARTLKALGRVAESERDRQTAARLRRL